MHIAHSRRSLLSRGLLAATAAVLMTLLLLIGCSSMKFEKIPDAEVSASQKAAAEQFGTSVLTAWARGSYPKVTVPADPAFKEAQDDEGKQKAAAKTIEAQLGTFESMTFHEAQKSVPAKFVLYRFKGKFSKGTTPAEVRVVYDTDGKLGGFWIKPWKDAL